MHRNIPLNRRVPHGALVMLERSAAKVARCVLRGLGEGDLAWLPGDCFWIMPVIFYIRLIHHPLSDTIVT
jgi:hypothetical protein